MKIEVAKATQLAALSPEEEATPPRLAGVVVVASSDAAVDSSPSGRSVAADGRRAAHSKGSR